MISNAISNETIDKKLQHSKYVSIDAESGNSIKKRSN